MDEKQPKTPNMQLVDIDRVEYMLKWRDDMIEDQKRQLKGMDDVIAICAAYINLIAGTAPEDVVIVKEELHAKISELIGHVTFVDEGDRVRFVLVEQTEDEAGDEGGEEGRNEEDGSEEEGSIEAENRDEAKA